MRFDSLVHALRERDPRISVINHQHLRITGLADDSRNVLPGNLFAAIPGNKADGTAFIRDALNRGASALLVPKPMREWKLVPQIVSPQPRRTLALLAALLYGDPSRHMLVLGVTGTNGKTTTAFLLREVLEKCGISCGLIGTVWNIVGGERREAEMTTPSPLKLQQLLAEMRARGQQACAMEVSSHALDQGRAEGIRFGGAIFTNLTRDHLDYHKTFENYFAAKARLFEGLGPDVPAVANLDDEYGPAMLARAAGRKVGFSLKGEAEYQVEEFNLAVSGMAFSVRGKGMATRFHSPMTGRYNVQNVAGVVALANELGLPLAKVRAAIMGFGGAPGRLERVNPGAEGPAVFVDYAHTPDAMENVLSTLRQVCAGRTLTCVFGCGGDRDRTKRPKMGAIAAELADRPIITSDNPRSENPAAILDEILGGIAPQRRPVETCVDRREAIRQAIRDAKPGEVVAILGKGHEDYQIFADRTIHFDDREEARAALAEFWGFKGSGRRATAQA